MLRHKCNLTQMQTAKLKKNSTGKKKTKCISDLNPLHSVLHTRAQAMYHHCRCWPLLFYLFYRQTLETNPANIRNPTPDLPAPPTLALLTIRNPAPDLPVPPIRTVQRSRWRTYRRITFGSGSHLRRYSTSIAFKNHRFIPHFSGSPLRTGGSLLLLTWDL